MPKTPITTFCLTLLMDLNFFNFLISNFELFQEETTAGFPALRSSHNRPCHFAFFNSYSNVHYSDKNSL